MGEHNSHSCSNDPNNLAAARGISTSTSSIDSETPIVGRQIRTHSHYFPSVFGHHMVTVEPVIFFFLFAIAFSQTVLTQFLLVRTCEVTLGINRTICKQLEHKTNQTAAEELENKVQPYTSTLIMSKMVIEACVPAILALFLGPWSDKYGRKLLLVWPLAGYTVMFLLLCLMSQFPELQPNFILIASLPVVFSGGSMSLIASSTSLLTDITKPERRSLRMGVFDSCMYLGFFWGTFLSGRALNYFGNNGYSVIFGTCCVVCFLISLYVITCIPESVCVRENYRSPIKNLTKLFDMQLLTNTLRTCFKKRQNCRRDIIFFMAIVMSTGLFTFDGESSIFFLFSRKRFGWNMNDFTLFFGTSVLLIVIGTLVGVTLISSYFKVGDLTFILFALFTKFVTSIMFATGENDWVLYVGSAMRFFGGVPTPLSRSFISKNVPKEIVGIVFSLTSASEALMPLVAAPLYTTVYKLTFLTIPGAIFYISTAVFGIGIILTSIVLLLHHNSSEIERID